jgi:hypothetical protein
MSTFISTKIDWRKSSQDSEKPSQDNRGGKASPISEDDRNWTEPVYEMQDFESSREFDPFKTYREMAPQDRALRKVADEHDYSTNWMTQLSHKYKWQERARKYDKALAEKATEAHQKKAEEAMAIIMGNAPAMAKKSVEQAMSGSERMLVNMLDRAGIGVNEVAERIHRIETEDEEDPADILGQFTGDEE